MSEEKEIGDVEWSATNVNPDDIVAWYVMPNDIGLEPREILCWIEHVEQMEPEDDR